MFQIFFDPRLVKDGDGKRSGPLFDQQFTERLASADVFSLGCVLAELFLGDGNAIFNLPELITYREGTTSVPESLKKNLKNISGT